MGNNVNNIVICLSIIGAAFVLSASTESYFDLPVVYESHSMQECVLVIDPVTGEEHTDWDCESLPPKYDHIFVQ